MFELLHSRSYAHPVTSSADLLRANHLRVTAARVAVLEVLAEQSHLTTDEVAAAVRRRIGAVSTQAIYHMLSALTSAELLRRFELAGGAARYERRVGDNHHHLVCRPCGEVTDVDCDIEDGPCVTPPDRPGYQIDEADVVFWGVCPRCQPSPSAHHNTRCLT